MSTPHYQIIKRPIITEKGLGVKELQHTVVFEVASRATKTQIKEAVQQIFSVKVVAVRTSHFVGKMRRRGQDEGIRKAGARRKNDRVRGESLRTKFGPQ
jgi:large subunit ribosomal protein L23